MSDWSVVSRALGLPSDATPQQAHRAVQALTHARRITIKSGGGEDLPPAEPALLGSDAIVNWQNGTEGKAGICGDRRVEVIAMKNPGVYGLSVVRLANEGDGESFLVSTRTFRQGDKVINAVQISGQALMALRDVLREMDLKCLEP